jgi:hypothetical protein
MAAGAGLREEHLMQAAWRGFVVRTVGLVVMLLGVAAAGPGCQNIRHSYVAPGFNRAAKADLRPAPAPVAIDVTFRWQTNGKDKVPPAGSPVLVTRLLESSACFSKVSLDGQGAEAKLDILVNNHGDMGAAFGAGFVSGLTLGGAGSSVTDHYAFSAALRRPGRADAKFEYAHGIISTTGLKSAPEGAAPLSSDEAFTTVMEELVFRMLKDMQDRGEL